MPGSVGHRAVAEYHAPTPPRMRVGHFNIAVVQARSNFKPGININGRVAVFNCIPCIDVVKVGAGVDEAPVELGRGVEGMGSGRGGRGRDV
jgi:hypothetical protein